MDLDTLARLYRERAHLVALLAAMYPSCRGQDHLTPEYPVIYIALPTGQVSWHISPSDLDLFGHVPPGTVLWDGHTTAEKHERIDQHTARLAAQKARQEA